MAREQTEPAAYPRKRNLCSFPVSVRGGDSRTGADEALMLDPRGFVASCNSTNFFIVRQGELWTSTGAYSFKGITQKNVIDAWTAAGGVARECDFTLAQVYSADEAFVTGTLGGVTPVTKVDGRAIGEGRPGAETIRAGELYLQRVTATIQV
jgi:branched-chain amino acid aminotransferase